MKTFRAFWWLMATLVTLVPALEAIPNPPRLFVIPASRFTIDDDGQRWNQRGQLDSFGGFHVTSVSTVPETVALPAEALDRPLIHEDAWLAFQSLGLNAVGNFHIVGELFNLPIGARFYAPIAVSEDARFDIGDLVNISARAVVTPVGDPLIGGFVIENQARRVLIRAVGPTLSQFGVPAPLADPYLNIYQQGSGTVVWYNDDWNQRYDAAEIKLVSAQVGAFALPDGSKDAAYLVELPPGAYTAHLTTYANSSGTALLEVYVLP